MSTSKNDNNVKTLFQHSFIVNNVNNTLGLKLEDHGIVTAVLELIKECSGEDGVCTLLLETLAYVLEGSSVDMPWLYSLGIINRV